jgi:hypothetical protein
LSGVPHLECRQPLLRVRPQGPQGSCGRLIGESPLDSRGMSLSRASRGVTSKWRRNPRGKTRFAGSYERRLSAIRRTGLNRLNRVRTR